VDKQISRRARTGGSIILSPTSATHQRTSRWGTIARVALVTLVALIVVIHVMAHST
jgi:hypothetical protein